MPPFQSTLGERDIAEELAAGQRQISIAEFFEKNKHMLGFDSGARALVTAVKEGVDNSLDATEEAGFLPDIYVEIREDGDYYTLVVEDNGPGITAEEIPKVFGKLLYGSRFHKREQSLTPNQRVLVRRHGEVEFIPIGTLCDTYLPSDGAATRAVPDEIEVPSFDRETHEMSWQPVTHAIRHETNEETYEITTEKGRTAEVTGNHSLFSLTGTGATKEVRACELAPGDHVLAPQQLPQAREPLESINLLEHLDPEQLDGNRLYVYGFDEELFRRLQTGETIRKRPSDESSRRRTYYRYNGVDVLKDSLDQQYLPKGFLPAETVLRLGWEEHAAGCVLRTYRVGGAETSIPVTVPLDDDFLALVAYYISEGHVDARQVGFTFGSTETDYIETTERAVAAIGGTTTTVPRPRNSTRVKAFGLPFRLFLENTCGSGSHNKRIPNFVFHASSAAQVTFLEALIQGDGSDQHPANELEHTTTSQLLARQVSALWNMQGVLASTEVQDHASGYAAEGTRVYRTKVYGADVNALNSFETTREPGEQGYKRLPTTLLTEVAVGPVRHKTVPDSVPGLLMGAGVGSSLEHARVYQEIIERAIGGHEVAAPRYVHNLQEKGLLDADRTPTPALRSLWETIDELQGFTDSDMCLLRVKQVEQTEPPEYVYDLSVPGAAGDDENFVVANEGALAVKNSRGQQGIGISAAVLYAQLTSGTPTKVTSRTPGGDTARYFELVIDTERNEPEISVEETTSWDRPHGTRIELTLEANMRARAQLHDYISYTAVVNPHARIELIEPETRFKFDRATDELPAVTESIRPHPHGVELGTLLKMLGDTDSYSLSGFLQEEFTRVGAKTAEEIIAAFRDRHFGREMGWRVAGIPGEIDPEEAIEEAVSNKGAEETAAFVEYVVRGVDYAPVEGGADTAHLDGLEERSSICRCELQALVETAARIAEDRFDTRFGGTVQEHAVDAAWGAITADRVNTLAELVDDATSDRKDADVVRGLADRLADKFAGGPPGDRATEATVREYVDRSADMLVEHEGATFGDTARENVAAAVWGAMRAVPDELPNVRDVAGDRDAAADLLEAMRAVEVMAPPTNCLAPIRAELIEEGLRKEVEAEFYAAATRDAAVHGGDPFIVEAGIAYGGELEAEGPIELMRFANRVPLVYQQGACAMTDVVRGIDWRNYGLEQTGGSGMPRGPAVVMVHVASTNVPFTSESKDAVANIPEIEKEVELAVRDAARDMKRYLNKRRSLQQRRRKQSVIADILPKMADKVATVTGRDPPPIDVSLARIMGNVLVLRRVDDGRVELVVENHTDVGVDLDVTEIVSSEPTDLTDGTPVDVDDEWFVKWAPSVPAGGTATLAYHIDGDASFDVDVDGVEAEKLTIHQ